MSADNAVAACAALLSRCRAQLETDVEAALRAALAICECEHAPHNLALQAHLLAAQLLYEHTDAAGRAVAQMCLALERCDAAPGALTLPVLCGAACILQRLIVGGELELARQLLEPLLDHLLQQRTDVVDASVDPLPLLACHVRVLQLVLLDAEGRLGAAAASLPAVRAAAQALSGSPAAPDAPHACWAQANALLRLLALLETALLWRRGELEQAEQRCAEAFAEAEGAGAAGGVEAAIGIDLLLLRAGLRLLRLEFGGALRDLAAARGRAPRARGAPAGGAGCAWHLRACHAALALEAPRAAEQHASRAAAAARHDGQRVWAELLLLLLRTEGGDARRRRAELRALQTSAAAAPQALLQALLRLLQTEAETDGGGGGEAGGGAEAELASCITSAESELGSAVLTTLALAAVARHARGGGGGGDGEGGGGGGGVGGGGVGGGGGGGGGAAVAGAKRKRTEDALMSALILAARMQDAHTQRAVLDELVRHHAPDDPAAEEYACHLKAKQQQIADAVGAATRSPVFKELFA